jgi:hypothetical protein
MMRDICAQNVKSMKQLREHLRITIISATLEKEDAG